MENCVAFLLGFHEPMSTHGRQGTDTRWGITKVHLGVTHGIQLLVSGTEVTSVEQLYHQSASQPSMDDNSWKLELTVCYTTCRWLYGLKGALARCLSWVETLPGISAGFCFVHEIEFAWEHLSWSPYSLPCLGKEGPREFCQFQERPEVTEFFVSCT